MVYMNEEYFRTWSYNMAYILGYITGDGCVWTEGGSYKLIIVSKDVDVLEFIRVELESPYSIKDSKDGTHRINICRKVVVMDLMAHGILPRKSWNPVVPDVPVEYRVSFLHGLFDADGSVWMSKPTGRAKVANITTAMYSYRKNFLQTVGGMIKDEIGAIPRIYPTNNLYRAMYFKKGSIAIYHMFYDTPPHDFFLQRKKDVFEEWLREHKKDMRWGLRVCRSCGGDFVALHENSSKCLECRSTKI